ncbi:MAG: ABC transporter permease [Acidimicrobiales bacterium]
MTEIVDPTRIETVLEDFQQLDHLPEIAKKRRLAHWPTLIAATWLILLIGYMILGKIFGESLPFYQDPVPSGFILDFDGALAPPSAEHWMGTDGLSRDVFSRSVDASYVSLVVALTSVLFGMFLGGFLGVFAGYVRGGTETGIMTFIDMILAFPAIVLLLGLITFMGSGYGLSTIAIAIGFISIPYYARVARANTLSVSQREFVTAAQTAGARRGRVLFREIIPNVLPSVLAYAMVAAGVVIVVEGALAFLGLSVQPPTPSWGAMINEGRSDLAQVTHQVFFPSMFLIFTVLSMNVLGDTLRRKFDIKESSI